MAAEQGFPWLSLQEPSRGRSLEAALEANFTSLRCCSPTVRPISRSERGVFTAARPELGAERLCRGYISSRTVPAPPSIVTIWPVCSVLTRPAMPTMVGIPISRATMAEWERMLPRSMSNPETDG
jgi:hypothetical protein